MNYRSQLFQLFHSKFSRLGQKKKSNAAILSQFSQIQDPEKIIILEVRKNKVCMIRLDHICFEKSSSIFWQVCCCAHRTRSSCQRYDEDFFQTLWPSQKTQTLSKFLCTKIFTIFFSSTYDWSLGLIKSFLKRWKDRTVRWLKEIQYVSRTFWMKWGFVVLAHQLPL